MDGSAFLWYIEVKDTAKKRRKWNMDQKEIEALIAAGGAPCEICGGRMLKVDGCTWSGVYSRGKYYIKKTLNEWSVHNGVDFLAEEGAAVVAICDGTVTSVRNEYGMGNIVEITHADGLVSSYFSLGDDIEVSEGDKVKKGDKIGSVSTSAAYECAEGAHLHLEMKKDGKFVNPANYFDINKD